jgi:DNA-directed RNA polymerase subunit RPC12/RpoP
MPKLVAYLCRDCQRQYEFLHHPVEEPARCPSCGSSSAEAQPIASVFRTIVPVYPGAKRRKAGYAHQFQNRPAERTSISVP